ncbi:MAG TPA: hypothetical protein PKC67_03600 [Kiritimatiellia bacterium]|nr:hypothetical protein [Kiritimatiellia bacterium]HMP33412.1 hypothetical protein [Kiritimatiellia bacterium]
MMQTLMRKMGYLAMVVGLAAVSTVQAAGAGADDAGNYGAGAFTNGSNLGSGFGAWEFNVGDGALVDLADSTSGTGNINSTNGVSFRFYGGSSGSYGEATRAFNAALAQGDIFSATIAYNWGGGARGINILDASNNELLNINFSDDNLSYTFSGALGVVVSSTYSDTASVSVVVGQLAGNQLGLTLTRNDGFTTSAVSTTLSAPAAKVKFYNGGHLGDNINYALFANNLVITPNPASTAAISGRDAMAVGMTNQLTLTRGGSNVTATTFTLLSSDTGVVDVPASVAFALGATVTNFAVEGIGFGVATVIATNTGYPDAQYDISVYDLGYDDSSYAAGVFTNGGNSGLGFEPWILQNNDGAAEGYTNFAGVFIGNSTFGGMDVNASSGDAFALYANGQGGGNPFANAIRPLTGGLGIGEVLSLEVGVNFRNGSKGVSFQNSGNNVFEFGVFNDDYWYKVGNDAPVNLNFAYASDSAFTIEFARISPTLYDITITRTGSEPVNEFLDNIDLGASAPNEVRFFTFNTDSGDSANNLYFNRLARFTGTEIAVLSIGGNDGMVVNRTNVFSVSRTGPVNDALEVLFGNANAGVASVPASVEIPAGTNRVDFEVVALSNGTTTITAEAIDAVEGSFELRVVDIAYDDTTYYPPASFDNFGNGGVGFGTWQINANTDGAGEGFTNFVGMFLGDSTFGGADVNDSEGESFGFYASGDGTGPNTPIVTALRPMTQPLGIGESMSFRLGVNFRNGAKGAMFQNSDAWLFEIGVFNDDYVYNIRDLGADNPVSLGWSYASDSAITVILSRVSTNSYNVRFIREGSAPENTLVQGVFLSQTPNQVRFYVFDTDGGDANNLYVNNLAVYTGIEGEAITDGIPNTWWDLYNIPVIDRVAAADFDNDGFSNLDEYIADTNPADLNSFFLNEITGASGSSVLSLQTGPTTNSRVYDIFWTTNLLSNPQQWNRLNAPVPGNGGTVTLSVTNDVPVRFYRTGVALP